MSDIQINSLIPFLEVFRENCHKMSYISHFYCLPRVHINIFFRWFYSNVKSWFFGQSCPAAKKPLRIVSGSFLPDIIQHYSKNIIQTREKQLKDIKNLILCKQSNNSRIDENQIIFQVQGVDNIGLRINV